MEGGKKKREDNVKYFDGRRKEKKEKIMKRQRVKKEEAGRERE